MMLLLNSTRHNASSPNPNFPSPFLHCSLNLSPLITFALFVARKVTMFSFCAVMTDVNYAPLNGSPSPLLTSGISHSLIPILRELEMDVSISAGSPEVGLDTGLSDMESACWKTSALPI
jgi:hypothetical protein